MKRYAVILAMVAVAFFAQGRTRIAFVKNSADSTHVALQESKPMSVNALDSLIGASEEAIEPVAEIKKITTPIMGDCQVDVERMCAFVRRHNADFDCRIAQAYLDVGKRYGIRGDIAFCQAILETGWFKFAGGTAVKAEQHNYCGLGVTRLGLSGASFDTIEQGVTAQLQHLYAYATSHALPGGEEIVDPRFKMVARGSAPAWEDLNMRWAMNNRYAEQILQLYSQMMKQL